MRWRELVDTQRQEHGALPSNRAAGRTGPGAVGVLLALIVIVWLALMVPVGVVTWLTVDDPYPGTSQGWGSDRLDVWIDEMAGQALPVLLLASVGAMTYVVRRASRS